jgi:hypothetical protein
MMGIHANPDPQHCWLLSKTKVLFAPQGVATSDSKVKVYDVRAMKLQQQYSAHEGPVNQVIM